MARRGDESPAASGPPAATTPATVATTTPSSKPITPPDPKAAVATAVAFMRREVGMADPVAGQFRWTGTRTGQVEVRARIPDDVNRLRGPVSVVSLQRLAKVWYVLGVRSDAIGVPQLPAQPGTITIRVAASHADRARLVYTPTGTETAWYAKVVSQDTTAGDGLRLTWHYSRFDALGNVMVVVLDPGGVATHDLFSAT